MRVLTLLTSVVVALVFSVPVSGVAHAEKRCHYKVHKSVKHGHRHHHPKMTAKQVRKLHHYHRFHHHHCHKVTPPKPPPEPEDTTPPDTIRSSSGYNPIDGRTYGFRATEEGCTFQCQDSTHPGWQACTSPYGFHPGPGPGWFEVRAIDPAGNVDPTPVHRDFVQ